MAEKGEKEGERESKTGEEGFAGCCEGDCIQVMATFVICIFFNNKNKFAAATTSTQVACKIISKSRRTKDMCHTHTHTYTFTDCITSVSAFLSKSYIKENSNSVTRFLGKILER